LDSGLERRWVKSSGFGGYRMTRGLVLDLLDPKSPHATRNLPFDLASHAIPEQRDPIRREHRDPDLRDVRRAREHQLVLVLPSTIEVRDLYMGIHDDNATRDSISVHDFSSTQLFS
jgi:hypothetical protein